MRRIWGWVFWGVVCLSGAAPSFGQMTGGFAGAQTPFDGYVRDATSERGIEGATIALQTTTGVTFNTAFSGPDGSFHFNDAGQADCYVVVQHDGYEPIRQFVRLGGLVRVQRDLYLRAVSSGAAAAPAPGAAPTVSAHELAIPDKARKDYKKGLDLIVKKSDYRGAVAQFQLAIELYPSYYEAYMAEGMAQYASGDSALAEASYKKSIELSSGKYPDAMIHLATLFNDKSRFAEAEPHLRQAIALDGAGWNSYYQLARALAGENHFAEAVESAAKARDLKPDNAPTYILLYNLHIQTDKYALALQDADAYLKLVPTGAVSERVRAKRDLLEKALQPAAQAQPVSATR